MRKSIKPEPVTEQGLCVECSKRLQTKKGTRHGQPIYRPYCRPCFNVRSGRRPDSHMTGSRKHYRHLRGDVCEACGFVPVHPCQLDVDHRDGDHSNHDPENLQTLCANCHRLKTIENEDHLS